MAKQLIGIKEIENFTRLSWPTIRRLINSHEFPAVKIDGVWVSSEEAIVEWFNKVVRRCPQPETSS